MDTQRPIGVAILSVLYWIGAVLIAIFGALWIAAGAWVADAFRTTGTDGAETAFMVFAVIGAFFIALGAGYAAIAVGLWRMRAWAWWVAFILSGIGALMSLYGIVAVEGPFLYNVVVTLIVDCVILVYLATPAVRAAFGVMDSPRRARPARAVRDGARCPGCQRTAQVGWRKCAFCGTSLSKSPRRTQGANLCRNPGCGAELRLAWRTCPYCRASAPTPA